VVTLSVNRNLAGIECLTGIPGSVGGTPVQNVGAYGQEISNALMDVRAYDRDTDEIRTLSLEQCRFSYRTSVFNSIPRERYIVLRVSYLLVNDGVPTIDYIDLQKEFEGAATPPTIADVRKAVRRIRERKAMLLVEGDPDCRSAGSFFKNP